MCGQHDGERRSEAVARLAAHDPPSQTVQPSQSRAGQVPVLVLVLAVPMASLPVSPALKLAVPITNLYTLMRTAHRAPTGTGLAGAGMPSSSQIIPSIYH